MAGCLAPFNNICAPDGSPLVGFYDVDSGTVTVVDVAGVSYSGPVQKCCCDGAGGGDVTVFAYVAFDSAVHVPGSVVGAGTVASPIQIPLGAPLVCDVTAGDANQYLGVRLGDRIHGCVPLDLAGNEHPADAGFVAADFPEFWVQEFFNGDTGSESWIVHADVASGALDWHQL